MTTFTMPPRAFANPGLYQQILTVYIKELDIAATTAVVGVCTFETIRQSLRQLGLQLRRGGSGQNRRPNFELDNPTDQLDLIRRTLERIAIRHRFLEDQGQPVSALATLVRQMSPRAFIDAPRCNVHDYRATLEQYLKYLNGAQVALQLDISPLEVYQRLADMHVTPVTACPPGIKFLAYNKPLRLDAMQQYLRLAVTLDPRPA